jgi:predicted RNase H-like nuclease (RuvC/YqgF family)
MPRKKIIKPNKIKTKVMTVNEVQEMKNMIESQKNEIERLNKKLLELRRVSKQKQRRERKRGFVEWRIAQMEQ